jgi:hypothetical protein
MIRNLFIASSIIAAVLCTITGASSGPTGTTSPSVGTVVAPAPLSGDAVFRTIGTDPMPFAGYAGHAGIVQGVSVMDMQMPAAAESTSSPSGFVVTSLGVWKRAATYSGAAHMGQSPEVGILIASSVRSQRYAAFGLTMGYKQPGVSFRSDGLLEWAYETNGLDIVPGDNWSTLSPAAQRIAMTPR